MYGMPTDWVAFAVKELNVTNTLTTKDNVISFVILQKNVA
jgi:hypothetical protein